MVRTTTIPKQENLRCGVDVVQHDEIGHILFPSSCLLVCLNDCIRYIAEWCDLVLQALIAAEFSEHHNIQNVVIFIKLFSPAFYIRFHTKQVLIRKVPVFIIHEGDCLGLSGTAMQYCE